MLTSLAAPVAGLNVGLMALTATSPGGDERLLTLRIAVAEARAAKDSDGR